MVEASKGATALNTPKSGRQGQTTTIRGNSQIEESKSDRFDLHIPKVGRSEERQSEEEDTFEMRRLQAPSLSHNQKCLNHQLLIHSYLKSNSSDLLCTKCIYERNLQLNQIEIVPTVVRDIKESIESTKVMIMYRKA